MSTTDDRPCVHCHTPFLPTEQEPEFCCGGCRFVNELLVGGGLDDFYKFQDGQAGRPVGDRPFEPAKTAWLEALILDLPTDGPQRQLRLRVSGITCVGCVWLIERLFKGIPGAVRANIFPATAEAEFIWESDGSLENDTLLALARELPRYGYVLEDPTTLEALRCESRKLAPRLGLCSAFAMNTMAFSVPRYFGMDDGFPYASLFDLIALLSSTLTLLVGGSYFFQKASAAIQHRSVHIDLPIALGLGLAYLGSLVGWFSGESDLIYFDFVATFTVLMLGGRYLHLAASERAQSQLQGQSAIPRTITLRDGTAVMTTSLVAGNEIMLASQQALPVAARLIAEDHDFSLAWMTGEPEPKSFRQGSIVPAGALPLGGQEVALEAMEDFAHSLVARLTREEAGQKAPDKVERILKFYLLTIIFLGVATGLYWTASGQAPLRALQVVISIFVISCPCAIGVSIPLVDRRAAAYMARMGVFIQRETLWNRLIRIRHLIFDKTGTLTLENPALIDSEQVSRLNSEERSILSTLTLGSLHPLSRTLQGQLSRSGDNGQPGSVETLPGLGSLLHQGGRCWTLGKPGWRGRQDFTPLPTSELSCELACDGEVHAFFRFQESLRPRTESALHSLARNYQLHILSGDQGPRVAALAETLGIPRSQAHGSLSPDDKQTLVQQLAPSLYLGDGMNDTLAFAASTVSGTPVADRSVLDQRSDFLFTCPGLAFLPTLLRVARWRRETVGLVLAFTILYNVLAVLTCMAGHMTPLLAAILMPLSSLFSLLLASRRLPATRDRFLSPSPKFGKTKGIATPGKLSPQPR